MNQALLDKFLERSPFLEATGKLDKGVFPEQRPVLNPILHPVSDLGVSELLEGANVALVGVLNVVEGVEGIHRREVIGKEMTSSKKGI